MMARTQTTQSTHNFILLLLADFISSFGSGMSNVALTLFIYGNTKNLMSSALFAVVTLLPELLLAPFLGKMKFHGSFRFIFALGEFLCVIPMCILLFINNILLIYLVFFLYSAIFFILECLRAEYLKRITKDEDMQKRQSASRTVNILVTVVSPLVGAAILTRFGVKSIYILDIVSYILAALIILFLKGKEKPSPPEMTRTGGTDIIGSIRKNKELFTGCLILSFVGGAVSILTLEYIYKVLHADAMQYSMLMSAMAFGGLVGSIIGGMPFTQIHLRKVSFICTMMMGGLLLAVVLKPVFGMLLVILLFSGILSALVMLYYSVELFNRSVEGEIRGQYAIFQNISDASSLVSKPFGGMLNQLVGCVRAISSMGIVFLLFGIYSFIKNTEFNENGEH